MSRNDRVDRPKASWDVENGDYLWDGYKSKRVERTERDHRGNVTVTFTDGTTQSRGKYQDFDEDPDQQGR